MTEPTPADANEYGPFMDDVITMKIVAMVQDEHAQVVGNIELDNVIWNNLLACRGYWIHHLDLPLSPHSPFM